MKTYKVKITETLEKEVEVEAEDRDEAEQIVSAIATHRLAEVRDRKDLNGLLYRADKLSRPCYCCKQESACNWKGDKKNRQLIW